MVLVICTGNICRSPLAERLLRAQVPPGVDIQVASAGTHGLIGRPIDHDSAAALRELGVDPDGHQARRLDRLMLGAADLILTATVAHRAIVLEAEPLLLAKAFTLREFGRLASLPPELPRPAGLVPTPDELRTRVALIARRRGQSDVAAVSDDIADPYGGAIKAARTAAAEISDAVSAIAVGLAIARPGARSAPDGAREVRDASAARAQEARDARPPAAPVPPGRGLLRHRPRRHAG